MLFCIWLSTESHFWASNPCFGSPQYCARACFCPSIVESVTWNMYLPIPTTILDLIISLYSSGLMTRCMHHRRVSHRSFILYQFLRLFFLSRCFCVMILRNKKCIISVRRWVVLNYAAKRNIRVQFAAASTTLGVRLDCCLPFWRKEALSPLFIIIFKYQKSELPWNLLNISY